MESTTEHIPASMLDHDARDDQRERSPSPSWVRKININSAAPDQENLTGVIAYISTLARLARKMTLEMDGSEVGNFSECDSIQEVYDAVLQNDINDTFRG